MIRRAAPFAAAAVLLASATARAEGASDLESVLEQSVVTTASMSAESESAAPATSSIVTAEQLRRYGMRTVSEAINFLALGMVTQDPLRAHEIGARGVLINADFGSHVLVLVNGHATTDPGFGISNVDRGLGVPIELVDHVEITLGPGSVLYGANAMLGVINVVTKRAKDYAGFHVVGEGEAMAPTDRQGTFVTPSFASSYLGDVGRTYRIGAGAGRQFQLFGRRGEVTFQAEYFAQEGPSLTLGPQRVGDDPGTGQPKRFSPDPIGTGVWGGKATRAHYMTAPSAYLRLFWGDFELNARTVHARRGHPYISSWLPVAGDFDDPATRELEGWMSLDLKHRKLLTPILELRSRAYLDRYSFQQYIHSSAEGDCLPGSRHGCIASIPQLTNSVGLEEQVSLDWARDGSFVTLVGADGRYRSSSAQVDMTDRATGDLTATLNPFDVARKTLGAYVQQTARPHSALALNAGARFDVVEGIGSHLSPRAAANVFAWNGGTFKAIYSEAFRAPTEHELMMQNPLQQLRARELLPETVRSVEGAFEQRWSSQRILFGVFKSWWNDMIVGSPATPAEVSSAITNGDIIPSNHVVLQYKNVSSIDNHGMNAAFSGTALDKRLEYGLNVTGAVARRSLPTGTQPLSVGPQLFGNARVSYDLQGKLPAFALAAHMSGPRAADRAFDGGFTPTPYAPPQLALQGAISGPVPGIAGLSYRLAASYSFASVSPYVAGPIQIVGDGAGPTSAELAPVVRLRTSLMLQYDFGSTW